MRFRVCLSRTGGSRSSQGETVNPSQIPSHGRPSSDFQGPHLLPQDVQCPGANVRSQTPRCHGSLICQGRHAAIATLATRAPAWAFGVSFEYHYAGCGFRDAREQAETRSRERGPSADRTSKSSLKQHIPGFRLLQVELLPQCLKNNRDPRFSFGGMLHPRL